MSQVHPFFLLEQFVLGFGIVGILYAAINRADRGTLWLFVKARAFRAFFRDDIVDFVGDRLLCGIGSDGSTVTEVNLSGESSAFSIAPFNARLIDCSIGALWLAGAAVDAFFGDHQCHRTTLF